MEEKIALPAASERSERRRPPVPRASPWLVIPHGNDEKDQAFFNICEPKIRTCRKCIPEMTRKRFWQSPSHQGWLVILCDSDADPTPNCNFGDCFLWNPVSLERIQLPTLLHWVLLDHYEIRGCVLSSPPRSTASAADADEDDDSMVFFLFSPRDESHDCVLVFCRPGEDKQWRRQELSRNNVRIRYAQSLFYFKGKLYVMCGRNWYLEIEKQLESDDDEDDDHQTFSIRSLVLNDDPFFPSKGGSLISFKIDHVESCNEIFKVVKYHSTRGSNKVVTSIRVLRLDFSLMASEEVKSLGDHVLFLGRSTTASCSAAELGLTRGCLFYTLPKDQTLYIFDIEDNATTVYLPCLKLPTPWFSPDWMLMMPTTVRVANGRRRIEDMLGKDEEEDNVIEVEENRTSINDDEKEDQEQKHNGGELEKASTWGLNGDILELIANYLHPVDYIHFRAVCKANRLIIPAVNWRTSYTENRQTTTFSPLLVFSINNDTIHNFIDPMHNNEKYLMNLSNLLVGATIRFSKGGWLLMSKGMKNVFFYNPFTRATMQLPDLPDDNSYEFSGISFSSLPTSSDCIVFAITQWSMDAVSIFVIARGDDFWTYNTYENTNLPKYMEFLPCLNNPVFYDGAFYCLDYNGSLGVFNIEGGFTWKVLPKPQEKFNPIYPSFLVECEGKLLSVDVGHVGKSIRIFRLDFSKMVWVKVESLGKRMLFISDTSCLSAIAPHSRMENKIYFPRLHGERILFYSLDTGRYHSLGSRHSALAFYYTKENSNCSWIEPNWSQTTEQELNWLSI
ncbi:Protein of unknown function DUF295 [Macleaya cordata]|uniref:KIB1-4 beta-propeller domain-containing protein n=1 Tax=Macleaya cordata TaxID=56857 RepID=A0A200QCK4_MACCD|nr:Protein of unknown function DUF295 [Macleaya cordata]